MSWCNLTLRFRALQTRRLARYGEKEVVKHMQEQRIAAHELFVETVEQSCRVVRHPQSTHQPLQTLCESTFAPPVLREVCW